MQSLCFAYSPYSNQELDELEKEFVALINQSNRVDRDPLSTHYLNQLGEKLSQASHTQKPVFFIVKSSEINAFAGPGGYIGVNTGLILSTENESELAGVLAHELAHVRLHHLYQLIEHEKMMRTPMLASVLAAAALGAINPVLGNGALMASLTGFSQNNINFVRANEKEADRIGIDMLKKAGFDARGMASFFKKMQQHSRLYFTDNIPPILRTHPMDDERIAEAENRLPSRAKPYQDTLEYQFFKTRVRVYGSPNGHGLKDYFDKCDSSAAACVYGRALTAIRNNQPEKAQTILAPLMAKYPEQTELVILYSEALMQNHQKEKALMMMSKLYDAAPYQYATVLTYSDLLMQSGQAQKALLILLKAKRKFKTSLPLCEATARAQSAAGKKGYAYLTEAECFNMQAQKREAYRQLKNALRYADNDRLLKMRIKARMAEIKEDEASSL